MNTAPSWFTPQQKNLYDACMTAILFGPAAQRVTERLYLQASKGMTMQDIGDVLRCLLYREYIQVLETEQTFLPDGS